MVAWVQVTMPIITWLKDTFLAESEISGSETKGRGLLGSHAPWGLQRGSHDSSTQGCIAGRTRVSCMPASCSERGGPVDAAPRAGP